MISLYTVSTQNWEANLDYRNSRLCHVTFTLMFWMCPELNIPNTFYFVFKAVIHEKFGDGIMSAIDFTLNIEKEEDPKKDCVKVIMSGKFLPYKKW